MATISGLWKWNDDLTVSTIDEAFDNINFTSNFKQFTSIHISWSTGGLYIWYDNTQVSTYIADSITGNITKIYPNPLYQILNFGSIEQEIDDNLYNIISTYATPITPKITFNSDVAVSGDLTVMGDTISESHQDLLIKDATIVANADNDPLTVSSVGTVYRTGPEGKDYGIIYNTSKNSVQLGEGTYDENGFTFDTDENGESLGKSLVTREFDETLTKQAIPYWDSKTLSLKNSKLVVKGDDFEMYYNNADSNYKFYLTESRLIFDGTSRGSIILPQIRIGEGEIRIGEAKLTEAILLQLLALLQNPTITNNNNLTGEV